MASFERDAILAKLRSHRSELSDYAVRSLYLFGSVARGEATGTSDVDLLVEFERPVGLFHFVRLRDFLARLVDGEVDLVALDAVPSEERQEILGDAVLAA